MKQGPDFQRRPNPCCGYQVDSAGDIEGSEAKPQRGDFNICLNCGAFLVYTDDEGRTRPLEPRMLAVLEPAQIEYLSKAREFIRARGPIR